jgi:hypothetical protein
VLSIVVCEKGSRQPIPCRIHLRDLSVHPEAEPAPMAGDAMESGQWVYHSELPGAGDHFSCEGNIEAMPLPHPGQYRYEITQGKEYSIDRGEFEAKAGEPVRLSVTLERLIDMSALGWYAGDLHNHRSKNDMPLLMKSEGVYVAPVPEIHYYGPDQWAMILKEGRTLSAPMLTKDGRCCPATIEEEWLNCMNYFGVRQLPLDKKNGAFSTVEMARMLTTAGAWLDLDRPTWWDAPLLVALAKVHSIGLLCNHFCRETVLARGNPGWSYMHDPSAMPGAKGYADWNFLAYSHFLNCGLRIPPSAGSASGVLNNPLGGNRVYVYCGMKFDCERWWKAFSRGEAIATNGPILIPDVNGQRPGYVFRSTHGRALVLKVSGRLVSQLPVSRMEISKDGRVVATLGADQLISDAVWSEVTFEESGWLALRALSECESTQYYACITAPYYVEIGDRPRRISRSSVRFFLDWLDKRREYFTSGPGDRAKWSDAEHRQAVEYYESLLKSVNTE